MAESLRPPLPPRRTRGTDGFTKPPPIPTSPALLVHPGLERSSYASDADEAGYQDIMSPVQYNRTHHQHPGPPPIPTYPVPPIGKASQGSSHGTNIDEGDYLDIISPEEYEREHNQNGSDDDVIPDEIDLPPSSCNPRYQNTVPPQPTYQNIQTDNFYDSIDEPIDHTHTDNSVEQSSDSLPAPDPTQRQKYINELIDTEEKYLQDLLVVLFHLINLLVDKKCNKPDLVRRAITQWETITNATQTFYRALRTSEVESRDKRAEWMIGKTLQQHLDTLHVYNDYCTWVNSDIVPFAQKEPSHKLIKHLVDVNNGVASYLLKPIQRIRIYPSSIQRILENTPKDQSDFEYLQAAFSQANKLSQEMTENIADDRRNLEALHIIQSTVTFKSPAEKTKFMSKMDRHLLHVEVLHEIKRAVEVETIVYLFKESLLLVSPVKPVGNISSKEILSSQRKIYSIAHKPVMLLSQLSLLDPAPSDRTAFHIFYNSGSQATNITLKASSTKKRDKWVQMITEAKGKSEQTDHFPECKPEPSEKYVDFVAEYTFKAVESNQVSITAGDVLKVSEEQAKSDRAWIRVRCDNGKGWCPRSYVKRLPEKGQRKDTSNPVFHSELRDRMKHGGLLANIRDRRSSHFNSESVQPH